MNMVASRSRDAVSMEMHFRVSELCSDYVECIDDDRLEEWPDLFTSECVYKVLPRENADRGLGLALLWGDSRAMLVDRVVSMRKANIYGVHYYRHLLSNLRVRALGDGRLGAQSNFLVCQTRADGATSIYSAGRYVDEIVEEGGVMRFRQRIAIVDTYRVDSLLVRPI